MFVSANFLSKMQNLWLRIPTIREFRGKIEILRIRNSSVGKKIQLSVGILQLPATPFPIFNPRLGFFRLSHSWLKSDCGAIGIFQFKFYCIVLYWLRRGDPGVPTFSSKARWDATLSQILLKSVRLPKKVLLGSVDGVRRRGRPQKKWTDNITDCTELTLCQGVGDHKTRSRIIVFSSSSGCWPRDKKKDEDFF